MSVGASTVQTQRRLALNKPEGPDTQVQRNEVPKAMVDMVFEPQVLENKVKCTDLAQTAFKMPYIEMFSSVRKGGFLHGIWALAWTSQVPKIMVFIQRTGSMCYRHKPLEPRGGEPRQPNKAY